MSLLSLILVACAAPKPARGPGKYLDKIKLGEIQREYIVRVPKNYDDTKSVPVVVALHGLTSNMDAIDAAFDLARKSDEKGFITIVPNGMPEKFRGWNTGFFALAGQADDTEFIGKALDAVESEFKVDKAREYVCGHSNGAMMALTLASKFSNRLAAVAGVSGTIGVPTGSGKYNQIPDIKNPVSVMMIHGMKDNVVAYKPTDKAMLVPIAAEEGAKWFAKQNGCAEEPEVSAGDKSDRLLYKGGKQGTEVVLIRCKAGTHEIPGATFNGVRRETAAGIVAIDEIWNFFKTKSKV